MSTEKTNAFLSSIDPSVVEEGVITPPVEQQPEEKVETPSPEIEDPTEQPEPPVEEEKEPEQQIEEYFSTFYTEEDEPQQQEETVETIQNEGVGKVQDKVKVNLKEYVESYKDKINEYFKYSSIDLETIGDTDLLKLKLKNDNPTWSSEDIEDELFDKYGIGLKLKTAPEDALPDEVDAINEYNERIKRQMSSGQRALKTAVQQARQEFLAKKESLELPEMELDVELNTDPIKIVEQYQAQQLEQANKFREEVWVPQIQDAIAKVGGFKQRVEVPIQKGDKVVSELTYKLSESEKGELATYLNNYQPHPSDEKYITNKETGEIDYTRFVSDKAKMLFVDKLINASVKDAIAQAQAKFIKEEIINFQDEPNRRSPQAPQQTSLAEGIWATSKAMMDSKKRK